MSDKVVVSFEDSVLRESDIRLLEGPHWLNDRIIGFYFEYLFHNKFDASSRICFLSPEVSQFLKLVGSKQELEFLEPLSLESKELILLAVNNATDPDRPGGSHWSLLVFSRQAQEFFHLDSSGSMNDMDARLMADRLHDFLCKRSSKFEFKFEDLAVLRQSNGYDCGVHVLCHAEHASRHLLVYGSPKGLEPLQEKSIKGKRAEILALVRSIAGAKEESLEKL
jgi:sentrin-specific protease 8